MKNWFENVTNLDELKREYRKLAMKYHPDCGGDAEIMKAINAQHDELFEKLKREQNRRADADETHRTKHTTETAEEFRDIINELLKLDGVDTELCGSWVWISGNTKKHKERLKELGCKWSHNKGMWYWRHPEDGCFYHKGQKPKSMEYIRGMYGSQRFTSKEETGISVA